MLRLICCAILSAVAISLVAACGGDSGPRRTIQIVQTDADCQPGRIDVRPNEPIRFEVRNDGKKDGEVEGIEGTNLEELLVPSGRTRSVDYDAPKKEGVQKIKCYVPTGSSTIIEVTVSGPAVGAADRNGGAGKPKTLETSKQPRDTVAVRLDSMTLIADKTSVSSGLVRFSATNLNTRDVHELVVLSVDGENLATAGEIENIGPGKSGEIVLDLPPGEYLLACLIAPGEQGSTVSHYQSGMKLSFKVTG